MLSEQIRNSKDPGIPDDPRQRPQHKQVSIMNTAGYSNNKNLSASLTILPTRGRNLRNKQERNPAAIVRYDIWFSRQESHMKTSITSGQPCATFRSEPAPTRKARSAQKSQKLSLDGAGGPRPPFLLVGKGRGSSSSSPWSQPAPVPFLPPIPLPAITIPRSF